MVRKRPHQALSWISENCRFPLSSGKHLAGEKVGKHLLPFQRKIIKSIFDREGNVKKSCFIFGCRKVSKTFLYSMCLWYLINDRKRKGWSAPVMASKFEQACLVRTQLLSQKYDKKEVKFYEDRVLQKTTGSRLDFLTNSPGGALGLESDGLCADEIGAYRSDATLVNLTTGGSLSPDNFLSLFSSNPPQEDSHFIHDMIRRCDKNDDFKVFRFRLPATKDWTEERNWAVANPFLQEYFDSGGKRFDYVMKFYRSYFNNAISSKSYENSFRRFLLGQYIRGASTFVDTSKIRIVDEEIYKQPGIRWNLGLDYSHSRDFTSVCLTGWNQAKGQIFLKPFLFLPNIKNRHKIQQIDFRNWESLNYLKIQDVDVLDGDDVAETVLKYLLKHKIVIEACVFDRALATHHLQKFSNFKCEAIRMTPREMTTPIREIERVAEDSNLHFVGENPCMSWMFENTLVNEKSKNYCIMDRASSRQSIDGPVSASLAMWWMLKNKKRDFLIMTG